MIAAKADISTVGDLLDQADIKIQKDFRRIAATLAKVGRQDLNPYSITLFLRYRFGQLHQVWLCWNEFPELRDGVDLIYLN